MYTLSQLWGKIVSFADGPDWQGLDILMVERCSVIGSMCKINATHSTGNEPTRLRLGFRQYFGRQYLRVVLWGIEVDVFSFGSRVLLGLMSQMALMSLINAEWCPSQVSAMPVGTQVYVQEICLHLCIPVTAGSQVGVKDAPVLTCNNCFGVLLSPVSYWQRSNAVQSMLSVREHC